MLHHQLQEREACGEPIRVAVIGAGKFATMFFHQAYRTPGLHVCAVCDLDPDRAVRALRQAGWREQQCQAKSLPATRDSASTWITDEVDAVLDAALIDVVVEATGDPLAGVAHAEACIAAGLHLVMVNVEADALAGPWLAHQARSAGLVYSMAYGDQPALISELVDWARVCGFEVTCAGKGTKYLAHYHKSTPDTVWQYYGISAEDAARGGMNPQMFNSFLDGTKSAIEMAAVANGCDLVPAADGLQFPPCSCEQLAQVLKPTAAGGMLEREGTVEVVSSLTRDGEDIERDLRWGVYVTFAGDSDYAQRCFQEYGLVTDDSGRYSALFRPSHLIGLELGVSVANAVIRGEPTGSPQVFNADVVAVAKRDLEPGEILDGEGGYSIWGRLMPAGESLASRALPIGLSQNAVMRAPLAAGSVLTRDLVQLDPRLAALRAREAMEREFAAADTAVTGEAVSHLL